MRHLARVYHFLVCPPAPFFHFAFAGLYAVALFYHLHHAREAVERQPLNWAERR